MNKPKYKIGDKVRIVRSDMSDLNSYLDRVTVIQSVDSYTNYPYRLKDVPGQWGNHEFELVESKVTQPKRDKIIQITDTLNDLGDGDIRGLSENGNLYVLRGYEWVLMTGSPTIGEEDHEK